MFNSSVHEWLETNNAAVLTWYSTEGRVEFVGPVMSRWVAKIANYVVETFGEGEQPSVVLDLPDSWRTVAWAAGAGLAGARVTISDSADLSQADIFVTADEGVARQVAESDPGLIVLLQDLGLMATSWEGELPEGVEDAIAEVSGQPDYLLWKSGCGHSRGHANTVPRTRHDNDEAQGLHRQDLAGVVSGRPALWTTQAWTPRNPGQERLA